MMWKEPVDAYAALLIDNQECGSRKRCKLRFAADISQVEIDRPLKFKTPVRGEMMVVFYQRDTGKDFYMKKYIGPVDSNHTIRSRAGTYDGTWLS